MSYINLSYTPFVEHFLGDFFMLLGLSLGQGLGQFGLSQLKHLK